MPIACRRCRRINPPGAAYCYFDGVALPGRGGQPGEAPAGSRPFPMPFTFPSGRACHNYNELALACLDDWPAALAVLREGHLGAFLGALGRVDLADAARGAALYPDPDRGLDQLLGSLPGGALTPPKLIVKTPSFDLGPLAVGAERRLVLTMTNGGTRLLYGSLTIVDTPWLFFGHAPDSPEKVFQITDRTDVPIEVAGRRLRASLTPLQGQILISTNGGTDTVAVWATVPPAPFPEGVLKGALTPRQLAEKAKAAPKAAAACFESGAVADWYRANGWLYPVRGPSASGLAAVQQFFEALCLAKSPRVTLDALGLELSGRPGQTVACALRVQTEENRPVFASASSDRLWLTVGEVTMKGRRADIPLLVRSVPKAPGETLTAHVTVEANGKQRFVVPVTLAVRGVEPFFTPVADDEDIPEVLPADERPVDELPVVEDGENPRPGRRSRRGRGASRGPPPRRGWEHPE
jgi:hypothetical protein